MTYEKIVTLYDTADHAEAARRNLEASGFPGREISMITRNSLGLTGDQLHEPGLWHRLFGREIQPYEATLYGRSVEAGGALLTVRVPEADAARVTSILNAHQSVDLLKRAEQQGLITAATKEKLATAPAAPVTRPAVAPTVTRPAAEMAAGEEILALAEEQINVAKRTIRDGATRIRRYVIETPVETQVTLHEEHARIVRRAIADPNYVRNIDWTDKTIEIMETTEEPVITKSAHIAEEVLIQKEGKDHVETVRDKVRRQQVEVERVAEPELASKK